MPEIRSDDGPRRLRLVWLGPRGRTLPFEWTYTQWLVCLILGSTGAGLAYLISAPFGIWGAITNAIAFGLPGGVFAGVWLMKKVSPDEPVLYQAAMYRHLLTDRGRPIPVEQRFDIEWPDFAGLTTTKEPDHDPEAVTPKPRRRQAVPRRAILD